MSVICPTITVDNSHAYRVQMEQIEGFAQRIHIDLMDGVFAPSMSVAPEQVWWPEYLTADIHIMFQHPEEHLETLIRLKPNLVTVHAESQCNIRQFTSVLMQAGIKCGVAILPETSITSLESIIDYIQHILIFSGNLGYQGGSMANLDLLAKASEAKNRNSQLELGWDGGVNAENVARIAAAGIDVINAGGFIQKSENPMQAYQQLQNLIA